MRSASRWQIWHFFVLSYSSLAPSEFCFVVMVLSHHSCLGNMCQFSWRAYKCHAKRDDLWIKVSAARSLYRLGSALPGSNHFHKYHNVNTHTHTHLSWMSHFFPYKWYMITANYLIIACSAVEDNWCNLIVDDKIYYYYYYYYIF